MFNDVIHHYGTIQSILYAPKSSVLHLLTSSFPQIPGNYCSVYCLHSLGFSGMSYNWNHTKGGPP